PRARTRRHHRGRALALARVVGSVLSGGVMYDRKADVWANIEWLLRRGHRAIDVLRVYAPEGITISAIYSRNSKLWHIPLVRSAPRGRYCPGCRKARPRVARGHTDGLCAECLVQRAAAR